MKVFNVKRIGGVMLTSILLAGSILPHVFIAKESALPFIGELPEKL